MDGCSGARAHVMQHAVMQHARARPYLPAAGIGPGDAVHLVESSGYHTGETAPAPGAQQAGGGADDPVGGEPRRSPGAAEGCLFPSAWPTQAGRARRLLCVA